MRYQARSLSRTLGAIRPAPVVAAFAMTLAMAAPASAPAAEAGANLRRPPGESANFTLAASNGYSLYFEKERGVLSVTVTRSEPREPTVDASGGVGISTNRYSDESIYTTRNPGTEMGQIEADLGPLGSVSVSFRPSGAKRVTTVDLEGKREDCVGAAKIVRRLGTFEGTIVFHAENGYTSASATSVRGSVGTSPLRACSDLPRRGEVETTDTEAVASANGESTVIASRTARGATFHALMGEQLDANVSVARIAGVSAPRSAFWFAADGTRAVLKPPAPFSGRARFTSRAGTVSLDGDMAVEFPGLTQTLTGEGMLSPRLKVYPAGRR
jgi:hypothetical protein